MLELRYMSEERLRTIGIPLGPRVRILQEAARVSAGPLQRPQSRIECNGAAIKSKHAVG